MITPEPLPKSFKSAYVISSSDLVTFLFFEGLGGNGGFIFFPSNVTFGLSILLSDILGTLLTTLVTGAAAGGANLSPFPVFPL